ncbi:MAG: hypothetical protein U0836_04810 [Pirellulales bacterium]
MRRTIATTLIALAALLWAVRPAPAQEPLVEPPPIELSADELAPEGEYFLDGPSGFYEAPLAGDSVVPPELLDPAQVGVLHVVAEGAVLSRAKPASVTLATQNGVEVLNSRQLDLNSSGGPHINVQYEFDFDLRLEVDYLGLQGWTAVANFGPGNYRLQGGKGELGPLADQFRAEYASDFHSTEINVQWGWCPGVFMISGMRFAELREHYGVDALSTFIDQTERYTLTYDTTNHLSGLQLGLLFRTDATGRRLAFEGSVRGALMGNRVNHGYALNAPDTGLLAGRVDATDAAFLGDVRCGAIFRWSPRFSIRAGYQLIGLSGVALSPEEVLATKLIPNKSQALSNGATWFQGMTLGFEYHW